MGGGSHGRLSMDDAMLTVKRGYGAHYHYQARLRGKHGITVLSLSSLSLSLSGARARVYMLTGWETISKRSHQKVQGKASEEARSHRRGFT